MATRRALPARIATMTGALACALGAAAPAWTGEYGGAEVAVKATYLYKLAGFVDWPPGVYSAPTAPLMICVQGLDPFGAVLDRATMGRRVGTHPVVVRRLVKLEVDSGCHVAYLAGGATQSSAQALRAVAGQPVLTVTDEAQGASARGIVHLLHAAGRVRFSIDAIQAEQNGVAISSKLMSLAVAVKR